MQNYTNMKFIVYMYLIISVLVCAAKSEIKTSVKLKSSGITKINKDAYLTTVWFVFTNNI